MAIERTFYLMPKAGNLNHLALKKAMLPEPAEGEVTVKVRAIGLNFADIFAMQGLYSATPKGSFIPGLEFAGEIIKTGIGVERWKEGDRVYGVIRFGAYASHLTIDQRYVIPMPEDWSYGHGAAYPVQVLTAYYALVALGNLQHDQTVLIQSGAGGVGIWANRIAKKLGAFTIGTVGSENKLSILDKEGFDGGFVRDTRFSEKLKQSLGDRSLNLVLESAGGRVFTESFNALAPEGRLVTFGSATFTPKGSKPNYLKLVFKYLTRPKIDPLKLPTENKSIMGFNLIWLYHQTEKMLRLLEDVNKLQLEKPYIGHRFNFEEMPRAIELFKSGATTGKVVVTLDQ